MTNEELQAFRQGFCEKAAELGILPSELLSYSGYKQAQNPITGTAKAITGTAKDTASLLSNAAKFYLAVGALGLVGGFGAGALGNYLYNKGKFELDPDDSILPTYGAVDEAKNLHLLAKYRNAKKLVQAGLS